MENEGAYVGLFESVFNSQSNLSNIPPTTITQTDSPEFQPETVYISSDDEDDMPLFHDAVLNIDPVTEFQGSSMMNPISLDSETEEEDEDIDPRTEEELLAERRLVAERFNKNLVILKEAGMDVTISDPHEYTYASSNQSETEVSVPSIPSLSLLSSPNNQLSSTKTSFQTDDSSSDLIIGGMFMNLDSDIECINIDDDDDGNADSTSIDDDGDEALPANNADSHNANINIMEVESSIETEENQSSSDESGEWEYGERTPDPIPINADSSNMDFTYQYDSDLTPNTTEEPDWSYVKSLNDNTKEWVRPSRDILPCRPRTRFPPRTSSFEMLEMINVYIESLGPLDSSTSQTGTRAASKATRSTRRQTTLKPVSRQSSLSSIQRVKPYVPYYAWYNSNWEDWAQFEHGDIIHWPFSEYERDIVRSMIEPGERFRRRLSTVDWVTMSVNLPGRTSADCQRYWIDHQEEIHGFHPHPIMITRKKARDLKKPTYRLLKERELSTTFLPVPLEVAGWCNLQTSRTFGDGSGDVFSLGILQNPRSHVLTVVAGSTCDSQAEYNRPGNLRLWRESSEEVQHLPCHNTPITLPDRTTQDLWASVSDVKISVDQTLIFSAAFDNRAMVWSSDTGAFLSKLEYHTQRINQISVKRDIKENVLATGSEDGDAVIWSVDKTGTKGTGSSCILDYPNLVKPSIECLEFGHFASDNILFTGVRNDHLLLPGLVQSFDVNTADILELYTFGESYKGGAISALAICPDGKSFATGNYGAAEGTLGDGNLYIHDCRITTPVIVAPTAHIDVNVVAYSPCLNYVASGNATNEIAIIDVRSPEKPLYRLSHAPSTRSRGVYEADIGISGVHWLSNGRTLITSGGDGMVRLWDILANGTLLKTYQAKNDITSLAVNEEAMVIVAGVSGSGGVVHVWGR
ncbi:WD40-repeat-containing domain protein [Phycomyces blakesleeanus]